jgi:pSer/pThr/pTyr-binding forkhead associated (FHA) protein
MSCTEKQEGKTMVNKKELKLKQTDRYIRYSIQKEDFSAIEYKVLMNQKEHGLLECYKIDYNGCLQLLYEVEAYKPLGSLLPKMPGEEFLQVVSQLYQIAEHIKNNGFMKNSHVEIAADKIFLDQLNKKVYLIYLPVHMQTEREQEALEEEIKNFLLAIIPEQHHLYESGIRELYEDIKSKGLSLEAIVRKINEGEYRAAFRSGNPDRRLVLVGVNMAEPMILRIDKDEYRIGKKVEPDQGLIANYPTVSREHCMLTRREGQYFITDLGSSNGTYINEQRIPGHVTYPIRVGDRIRLANLIFDVMEEEA